MTRQESLKQQINNCRRRLNKLEEKRAYQGAEVSAHTLMEIEDAKVELKKLGDELKRLETEIETAPITDEVSAEDIPTNADPKVIDPPQTVEFVGGNRFDITVGHENQNIAIGENVSIVTGATVLPTDQDRIVINNHLENLRQVLGQLSHLSHKQQILAEDRLNTLVSELTKTNDTPNLYSIKQASEWLLDNVPDLSDTLDNLFKNPTTITLLSGNKT